MQTPAAALIALLIAVNFLPNQNSTKDIKKPPILAELHQLQQKYPTQLHLSYGLLLALAIAASTTRTETTRIPIRVVSTIAFTLIPLLEISQKMSPTRTVDPEDILWGWMGAALTIPILLGINHINLMKLSSIKNNKP